MEVKKTPSGIVLRYSPSEREELKERLEKIGTEDAKKIIESMRDKSLLVPSDLHLTIANAMVMSLDD